ncbi:hypothetical protein QUB56_02265 [Microcoleus sp. AR_TQ3_B6]|uniref:hypothetical protein n=1 Tax=Microcoleus sp. AR_TQ3_B6 TaxID=3055284 RepID=UPI002FD1D2C1
MQVISSFSLALFPFDLHGRKTLHVCESKAKYSRFRVDEVHPSSDRELTGNGTAPCPLSKAMYLTYLKNAVTRSHISQINRSFVNVKVKSCHHLALRV